MKSVDREQQGVLIATLLYFWIDNLAGNY